MAGEAGCGRAGTDKQRISARRTVHGWRRYWVCPISSRVRPFPTSVVLPDGLPISGEILLSRLRSIDTLARPVRAIGAAALPAVAAEVRAKLAALITI